MLPLVLPVATHSVFIVADGWDDDGVLGVLSSIICDLETAFSACWGEPLGGRTRVESRVCQCLNECEHSYPKRSIFGSSKSEHVQPTNLCHTCRRRHSLFDNMKTSTSTS